MSVDKVAVVRKPADPEHDQDDAEHLGQLPLVVHLAPLAQALMGLLVAPEGSAQVAVGDGEAQQGQHVGHQEEQHLKRGRLCIKVLFVYNWLQITKKIALLQSQALPN